MEDMTRLALYEQSAENPEAFNRTLSKLLEYFGYIIENPDDLELRTIKSELIERALKLEPFTDYLKYIGFEIKEKEIKYPKEKSLNRLRIAQAAIERKLYFISGETPIKPLMAAVRSTQSRPKLRKTKLTPVHVLRTQNQFLLKIQDLFNEVLKYEDEDLQQAARDATPLITLQVRAIDRMREHQKRIKDGEIPGPDLNYDIAFLMELLLWFKYSFFTWVDKPECESCAGQTVLHQNTMMKTETETCRLEVYRCQSCAALTRFPRHNCARTLLRTRRGRCGEWANTFTLVLRSVGYDARFVYDVTDHVWCEVFDYDRGSWLHVDPCEAQLDAPLVYERGWGKRVSYVVAVARDDLQDVTWRYSSNHKEVLKRRNLCSEKELLSSILTLRQGRQAQVSEPRRKYLAKRALQELVQIMVERQPSENENHGRISGSKEWRSQRGEVGNTAHTFNFDSPANYVIRYYGAIDKYRVTKNGGENETVNIWSNGAFECKNLFRKVEKDWRMVYLAREEGETTGSITWRISTSSKDVTFTSLAVRASTKLYENGKVKWTLSFDGGERIDADLGETTKEFSKRFKEVKLTAELTGGRGDVAWQHSQLFRQSLDAKNSPLEINIVAVQD